MNSSVAHEVLSAFNVKHHICWTLLIVTFSSGAIAQSIDAKEDDTFPKFSSVFIEGVHSKSTVNSDTPSVSAVSNTNTARVGAFVKFSKRWTGGLSVGEGRSSSSSRSSGIMTTSSPKSEVWMATFDYKLFPLLSVGGFGGYGTGNNSVGYSVITTAPIANNSASDIAGTYAALILPYEKWILLVSPSYLYSKTTNISEAAPLIPGITTNVSINMMNLTAGVGYLPTQSWRLDSGVVARQILSQSVPTTSVQMANLTYMPYLGAQYTTDDKYQLYIRANKILGDPRIGYGAITLGISKGF